MNPVRFILIELFLLLSALAARADTWGDFVYTASGTNAAITGYTGAGGSVVIPPVMNSQRVTTIGMHAFYDCTTITALSFPDSLTSIEEEACGSCSGLTHINLPASLTNFDSTAFLSCSCLTSITVSATNAFFSSPNGVLFNKSLTRLIEFPPGRTGGYAIPPGVTVIGNYAFDTCAGITNLTFPSGITSIGMEALEGCTGLGAITLPDSLTRIDDSAFAWCENLVSIYIPASVSTLGNYAFAVCSSLNSVYFPGRPPAAGSDVFAFGATPTVYFLSTTNGWGNSYAGCTALLWNPAFQSVGAGSETGPVAIGVAGTTNIAVCLDACTNLTSARWVTLQTATLTTGAFTFVDAAWSNNPARYYRLRGP